MARKPLIISRTHPYHVTNRSNNKEWFYIPIEDSWQIFTNVLARCCELYEAEIHSFVLMSNHYHLILSTPLGNLSPVVRYFQTEVSRGIQKRAGRINHIFGGRYKWSTLMNSSAIAYGYKYVARNPVAAGITERVENYPYSSLYFVHRDEKLAVPLFEDLNPKWSFVPKEWSLRLEWLNKPTPKEYERLISKALRRCEFEFSKGNDLRRSLQLMSHSYGIPLPPTQTLTDLSVE